LTLGSFLDDIEVVWEPPMADVKLADRMQTKRKTAQLNLTYWEEFIRREQAEPKKLGLYLNQLATKKNVSKQNMEMLFRDAMEINQGIEQEIGTRMIVAATIKFVANTAGIVLSGGLSMGVGVAFGAATGLAALRVQFYQDANAFEKAAQGNYYWRWDVQCVGDITGFSPKAKSG